MNGNIGSEGSLDNDNVAQAILQYWNTLIQSSVLSPVQLLLHRQLCDSIPSLPILYNPHPEWVAVAQCRKEILRHRNAKKVERYNKYTHNLPLLQGGDKVGIQSQLNHRWNTMGKIITILPDCQYRIRVDGSGRITLEYNRFLRKCELKPAPTAKPSATLGPITPTTNAPLLHPYPSTSSGNGTCTAIEPHKWATYTSPCFWSSRKFLDDVQIITT